jgi:hypothetical protein
LKVDLVCRSLEELDCFVPGKVDGILAECFDISADASYFFHAARSVWSGRVSSEEVLEGRGIFVAGRKSSEDHTIPYLETEGISMRIFQLGKYY